MRDSRALLFSSPLLQKWAKEVRKTDCRQKWKYTKNVCFLVLGLDNGGWVGGALNNSIMIGWGRWMSGRTLHWSADWLMVTGESAAPWRPLAEWFIFDVRFSNLIVHSKRPSFGVFSPADIERRSISSFLAADGFGIVTWNGLRSVRGTQAKRKQKTRRKRREAEM